RGRAGRRGDAGLHGRRGDARPAVRRLAARYRLAVVRLAAAAGLDQPDRWGAADHLVATATARRAVVAAVAAPAGRLDPAGRGGAERAPDLAPVVRRGAGVHRRPRRDAARPRATARPSR